jgi:hypothetical protein
VASSVEVLLARPADSEGYTRFLVADAIGSSQAGAVVRAELAGGGQFEITLCGQREFDVPGRVKALHFPDGAVWKPK